MLSIGSDGALSLEGKKVSLPMDEMGEFIMASLSEPCKIDGACIGDLMNVFFHVQPFIQSYFMEEYHALSAVVSTLEPKKKLQRIEFIKCMIIDGDGKMTIVPKVNIVVGNEGTGSLRATPVVLIDRLDISGDQKMEEMELKVEFTLLEVMDCVFSEFSHILMSGSGEYVHIWSL